MEDEAVHVVGDVGQRQFRLGALKADRADEEAEPNLLIREDMVDGGSDRGLLRFRAGGHLRHRLARQLAAMDAARQHPLRQPRFVLLTAVGAVGPDLRAGVVLAHQALELPSVGCRGRCQWNIEIIKRSDAAKGFVVLPRRWVVERTFTWLGRCRRLAKDWEKSIESATAWANIASIRGGSVCLNSFWAFRKWISASVGPPPLPVSAR